MILYFNNIMLIISIKMVRL